MVSGGRILEERIPQFLFVLRQFWKARSDIAAVLFLGHLFVHALGRSQVRLPQRVFVGWEDPLEVAQ